MGLDKPAQRDRLASRIWPCAGQGGVDHRWEVHRTEVEPHFAAYDTGNLQYVLHQPRLRPGIALDDFHALADFCSRGFAAAQNFDPAEDGVERRAQFVGENRQEFVFAAVGAFSTS